MLLWYLWKNRKYLLGLEEVNKALNQDLTLAETKLREQRTRNSNLSSELSRLNQILEGSKHRLSSVAILYSRLRHVDSIDVCLSKKQYETFDEAKLTAWVIYTKTGNVTKTEPYQCPACGKYHLTSTSVVPKLPKGYNPTEKANIGYESDEFKSMISEILQAT